MKTQPHVSSPRGEVLRAEVEADAQSDPSTDLVSEATFE